MAAMIGVSGLKATLSTIAIAIALSSSTFLAQLPPAGASTTSKSETAPASAAAASTAAIMPLPFRRYPTAGDIPKSLYKNNRVIRGRVVKVIDGDTIRITHTPFYPLRSGADYTGKLSENTISVRLYGVDAPELAKFGNPSQPFAEEAKDWVSSRVDGKMVRVKLLRKDQYSRAVGKVTTRHSVLPFLRTDLTKGLAERGYATLYTGGGAEYDGKRDLLEKKIKRAQRRKRGIWINGVGNHADPAAYKREVKARNAKRAGKENRRGAPISASVY